MNVPPSPGLHNVGLYVAHDQHAWHNESRLHTFGIVMYSDHLAKEMPHANLHYRDLILYERRLQPTIFWPFNVGAAKGERTAQPPGPWRKFDITVGPAAVAVAAASDPPFATQDGPARRAIEQLPGVGEQEHPRRQPGGLVEPPPGRRVGVRLVCRRSERFDHTHNTTPLIRGSLNGQTKNRIRRRDHQPVVR